MRVEPNEVFARNLRAARKEAGLTQEALGHAANMHPVEVSRLERAVRDPRLSTISRLARALRMPTAELVRDA